MQKRKLGNGDLEVSAVGFGCMGMSQSYGPNPGELRSVVSVLWEGFETAVAIRTAEPYVSVRAEDSSGRVLGASKAIKVEN